MLRAFNGTLLYFLTLSVVFFGYFAASTLYCVPFFLVITSCCLGEHLISGSVILLIRRPRPSTPRTLNSFATTHEVHKRTQWW